MGDSDSEGRRRARIGGIESMLFGRVNIGIVTGYYYKL